MSFMSVLCENADVKVVEHLEEGILLEITGSKEIAELFQKVKLNLNC